MKHAERTNERENRHEPQWLEQDQTFMFIKKPQEGKAQWSSGTVVSGDVQRLYTVEDDAAVHIKPLPGYVPIRPTTKVFSESREGGAPVPVETPNKKATSSPPKPKPETLMKRQASNSSHNVQTSQPRGIIRAPVKYGYEENFESEF